MVMSLSQWKDHITKCEKDGSFGFSLDDIKAIVRDWEADREDLELDWLNLRIHLDEHESSID